MKKITTLTDVLKTAKEEKIFRAYINGDYEYVDPDDNELHKLHIPEGVFVEIEQDDEMWSIWYGRDGYGRKSFDVGILKKYTDAKTFEEFFIEYSGIVITDYEYNEDELFD